MDAKMDSSSSEGEVLAAYLVLKKKKRQRMRKRYWVHDILKRRTEQGDFCNLAAELENDAEKYWNYFKMNKEDFEEVLNLIYNDIEKERTQFRIPVSPAERLAVCIRFLVTGDSYRSIAFSFRLGKTTVSNIVKEVCQTLWQRLQPIVMPEPNEGALRSSAEEFERKWQYPNCVAAIDGKHVLIECPRNSGSMYFNYKKTFSIVLLALVDANYKFIAIDVGSYGRNSDSSILAYSKIGKLLEDNKFGMPPDKVLPGTNISMPFVIVGDEAFSLSSYMMRPYPRASAREEYKLIYNYRHCRARRVSENCFGIMAQKYKVYRRPLQMHVETVIKIVKATCCLHNFMRGKSNPANVTAQGLAEVSIETNGFEDIESTNRRGKLAAYEIRDKFANYFTSPNGSVPWQLQRINRLE